MRDDEKATGGTGDAEDTTGTNGEARRGRGKKPESKRESKAKISADLEAKVNRLVRRAITLAGFREKGQTTTNKFLSSLNKVLGFTQSFHEDQSMAVVDFLFDSEVRDRIVDITDETALRDPTQLTEFLTGEDQQAITVKPSAAKLLRNTLDAGFQIKQFNSAQCQASNRFVLFNYYFNVTRKINLAEMGPVTEAVGVGAGESKNEFNPDELGFKIITQYRENDLCAFLDARLDDPRYLKVVSALPLVLEKTGELCFKDLAAPWILTWQGQRLITQLHDDIVFDETLLVLLNRYHDDFGKMTNLIALLNHGNSARFLTTLNEEWICTRAGSHMLLQIEAIGDDKDSQVYTDLINTSGVSKNYDVQLMAYVDDKQKFDKFTGDALALAHYLINLVKNTEIDSQTLADQLCILERKFDGLVFSKLGEYLLTYISSQLQQPHGAHTEHKLDQKDSDDEAAITVASDDERSNPAVEQIFTMVFAGRIPMHKEDDFLVAVLNLLCEAGLTNDNLFLQTLFYLYTHFPHKAAHWFLENQNFASMNATLTKGMIVATAHADDPNPRKSYNQKCQVALAELKAAVEAYKNKYIAESKSESTGITYGRKTFSFISMDALGVFAKLVGIVNTDQIDSIMELVESNGFLVLASEHAALLSAALLTFHAGIGAFRVIYKMQGTQTDNCIALISEMLSQNQVLDVLTKEMVTPAVEVFLGSLKAKQQLNQPVYISPQNHSDDEYVYDLRFQTELTESDIHIGEAFLTDIAESRNKKVSGDPNAIHYQLIPMSESVVLQPGRVAPDQSNALQEVLNRLIKPVDAYNRETSPATVFMGILNLPKVRGMFKRYMSFFLNKNQDGQIRIFIADPSPRSFNTYWLNVPLDGMAGNPLMARTHKCKHLYFLRIFQALQLAFPGAKITNLEINQLLRPCDSGYHALETMRNVIADQCIGIDDESVITFDTSKLTLTGRGLSRSAMKGRSNVVEFSYDETLLIKSAEIRSCWYGQLLHLDRNNFLGRVQKQDDMQLPRKAVTDLIRAEYKAWDAPTAVARRICREGRQGPLQHQLATWDATFEDLRRSGQTETLNALATFNYLSGLIQQYDSIIPRAQHIKYIVAAVYKEKFFQIFDSYIKNPKNNPRLLLAESKDSVDTFISPRHKMRGIVTCLRDFCFVSDAVLLDMVKAQNVNQLSLDMREFFVTKLKKVLRDPKYNKAFLSQCETQEHFIASFPLVQFFANMRMKPQRRQVFERIVGNVKLKADVYSSLFEEYRELIDESVNQAEHTLLGGVVTVDFLLRNVNVFSGDFHLKGVIDCIRANQDDNFNNYILDRLVERHEGDQFFEQRIRQPLLLHTNVLRIQRSLKKFLTYIAEIRPQLVQKEITHLNQLNSFLKDFLREHAARTPLFFNNQMAITQLKLELRTAIRSGLGPVMAKYKSGMLSAFHITNGLRYFLQQIFQEKAGEFLNCFDASALDRNLLEFYAKTDPWLNSFTRSAAVTELTLIEARISFKYIASQPLTRENLYLLITYWYTMDNQTHWTINWESAEIITLTNIAREFNPGDGSDVDAIEKLITAYYQNSTSDKVLAKIFTCLLNGPSFGFPHNPNVTTINTIENLIAECSGTRNDGLYRNLDRGQQAYLAKIRIDNPIKKSFMSVFTSVPAEIQKIQQLCKSWRSARGVGPEANFSLNRIEYIQLQRMLLVCARPAIRAAGSRRGARSTYETAQPSSTSCLIMILAYEFARTKNEHPSIILELVSSDKLRSIKTYDKAKGFTLFELYNKNSGEAKQEPLSEEDSEAKVVAPEEEDSEEEDNGLVVTI